MKKEKREGYLEKRNDGSFRLLKQPRTSCCQRSIDAELIICGDFKNFKENDPLKVEGIIYIEKGQEIMKETIVVPTKVGFPFISLMILTIFLVLFLKLLKRRLPLP